MKTENDYKKIVEQKDRMQRFVNKMKSEAMDDGTLAYANNIPVKSNPYPKSHQLHLFWIDGWNEEKYLQENERCS